LEIEFGEKEKEIENKKKRKEKKKKKVKTSLGLAQLHFSPNSFNRTTHLVISLRSPT
jgi:hypothetical protein